MTEFYSSEKKKIRGFKRHKRKIYRWKQSVMHLDMDYIRDYQRDYAKLWIHPFYTLSKKNPPNWFNRLLLNEMLDVYLHWHQQMTAEEEEFYLKIWLYDPNFIRSQIVVAYKEFAHFYDNTFDNSQKIKPFPIHKYASLQERLAMFDWTLLIETQHYSAVDMQEDIQLGFTTGTEVQKVIKKSYKTQQYQDDTLYSVRIGDVWVGTLKQ